MNTNKKVLIVEDDLTHVDALKKILLQDNFQILVAGTAEVGLGLAKKESPDLVLLDIMLPGGKNGFDFLEEIKKDSQTSAIPVVVLTNLEGEEKTAKDIGAADYIVKSNISIAGVRAVVEKILK